MRCQLLGTGCPIPDVQRQGPSQVMLFESGESVLVDCGSGAAMQLVRAGVPLKKVKTLLFTHHHSDHNIDYGHFLLTSWVMGRHDPLRVYGGERMKRISETLLDLHAYDIELRRSFKGGTRPYPSIAAHEVDQGFVLEGKGWRAAFFENEHPPVTPSFGIRFEAPNRCIVISGDTRPCDAVIKNARGADVLIHECMQLTNLPPALKASWNSEAEMVRDLGSYHTLPEDVGKVAREARVKKLVLTHLVPNTDVAKLLEVVRRDYQGEIVVGEDLMVV
ncbi:MAG: MBL fold metallo-hydrolase [Candidatus Tectomicrobia bacterium]|nr:MBL fold metallo-hydrolase [Candidatus Tectomicrobia bacterium]